MNGRRCILIATVFAMKVSRKMNPYEPTAKLRQSTDFSRPTV